MKRILFSAIAAMILAAYGHAQALPASATNDGVATTTVVTFPAASLDDDAWPLFLLPEDQAIAGRRRLLVLPLDSEIPDHRGQPRDIDAIVLAISKAMANDAVQSGRAPPSFISGVRAKVQEKLTQVYRWAVSLFGARTVENATPAEVAAGIPDVP